LLNYHAGGAQEQLAEEEQLFSRLICVELRQMRHKSVQRSYITHWGTNKNTWHHMLNNRTRSRDVTKT